MLLYRKANAPNLFTIAALFQRLMTD